MARSTTVPFVICPCGKRGWYDEDDAEKALGKARTKRERSADKGPTRRGMYRENRIYYCIAGDLHHLTEKSRRQHQEALERVAA